VEGSEQQCAYKPIDLERCGLNAPTALVGLCKPPDRSAPNTEAFIIHRVKGYRTKRLGITVRCLPT